MTPPLSLSSRENSRLRGTAPERRGRVTFAMGILDFIVIASRTGIRREGFFRRFIRFIPKTPCETILNCREVAKDAERSWRSVCLPRRVRGQPLYDGGTDGMGVGPSRVRCRKSRKTAG
ncbi:MAG: hypothetical protein H6Q82_2947 [Deltaproteobacteria bacterium]|nr:hypothetical protein [Deltaproteobacteria bacterium]